MLKTYRIIPLVFILFLFGLTLITASPVIAQTVDQLIERIEALDVNDRAKVLEYKYSPKKKVPSASTTHAKVTDGPWNPSMGMCHNSRPCMITNTCGNECNKYVRKSKGYVTTKQDQSRYPAAVADCPAAKPSYPLDASADGPWDPSMGMRHPARPCMKAGLIDISKGCGLDNRKRCIIARDPYDKEYIILKRAAHGLKNACFSRCEGDELSGWMRAVCRARCVSKRPNPRCKAQFFNGFYTTERSLLCLNTELVPE